MLTQIPILAKEVYKGFTPAVDFLNAISTKYEKGIALGTGKVGVVVVKSGGGKVFDRTKGYEFDDNNSTTEIVEFSNPIYIPTAWSSLEHSETGFMTNSMRTKVQLDGATLGNMVFANVEAEWKKIDNTVSTIAESVIDIDDIADLRQKAQEIGNNGSTIGWSIVLSNGAYTQLLKENKIVSEAGTDDARVHGEIRNLFGIDIYGASVSSGITGYLVHASSTAFGSQIVSPAIPEAASKSEIQRILTDTNGNGINLLNKIWHDSNMNIAREVLECWCGCKVLDNGAGIWKIASA